MKQSNLFAEPTYRVSQLAEEVRLFLSEAFPDVWVVGEVQRLRRSRRGHVYLELVEKGAGDEIVGKLEAVLWRTAAERVRRRLQESAQELVEGAEIRCRGRIDFYPPGGRLQLAIDEVDPVFSLGELEQRRRATLAALSEAGLLHRNGALSLDPVPLRVGLVTSHGSAAYHDFLSTLRRGGFGFEVIHVHAAVQGVSAEREVTSALRVLAGASVAATVVVRGGGSRSDLAVFDSRRVAEAIARHPFPVITGLGHEIDRSVCDDVAHTRVETPTGAAELLLRRVAEAETTLGAAARRLAERSRRRVEQAGRELERAQRRFAAAGHRTARQRERLETLARTLGIWARRRVQEAERRWAEIRVRIAREAPRRPEAESRRRDEAARRLVSLARIRIEQARRDCEARSRLCRQLAPERVLERGFSLTRGADGRLLTDADLVSVGDRITTRLANGQLTSRVEESKADST